MAKAAAAAVAKVAREVPVKAPDRRRARGAHSDSHGRAEATRGEKKGDHTWDTHGKLESDCRE